MTASFRPSARALYPLGITFSMLVLAYSLNSVVEALLQRRSPVRYVVRSEPADAALTAALDAHRSARQLGLPAPVSRASQWESCDRETPPRRFPCPRDPSTVVRQRGPTLFEVSPGREPRREEADSLCDVAFQARIVPVFRNGKALGFKLFHLQPESIYAQLGLRDCDLIRQVNGINLDSPEKVLELYTQLKDASRIELLIERDGKRLRHTYLIRR